MFNIFRKKALAIKISNDQIVVNFLQKKQLKSVTAPLAPGIVQDGIILKKENLAATLTALLEKYQIKRTGCLIAIPESQCFRHVLSVAKDLKSATLDFHLETFMASRIPIPKTFLVHRHIIIPGKEKDTIVLTA